MRDSLVPDYNLKFTTPAQQLRGYISGSHIWATTPLDERQARRGYAPGPRGTLTPAGTWIDSGARSKPLSGSAAGSGARGSPVVFSGAIVSVASLASVGCSPNTLTITFPVAIASAEPPCAELALTPRNDTVGLAVAPPGTKLLSGEVTIDTGVTHVYWPPSTQSP